MLLKQSLTYLAVPVSLVGHTCHIINLKKKRCVTDHLLSTALISVAEVLEGCFCALQVAGCPSGVRGELHCPVCSIVCSDCTQQTQCGAGWPLSVLLTAGKFAFFKKSKTSELLDCIRKSEP